MPEIKETPLVSVIMIFLNAEKFIQEAIESVLSQTYVNWELVFVDDGSSDASTNIALRYARLHPARIRYFEHMGHENLGMSASRNLGIRRSRGEYIALLDADDVYFAEKLEQEVALLEKHPGAAMVYGTAQYWYSWTGDAEDQGRDQFRTLGVDPDSLYNPPELVVRFLQNIARTPCTCSVLIRRKAIEKVGGFEADFSGMFEDQVFFYKLCMNESVYVESGCWARYRQHPDSWCHVSLQTGQWDPGHRLSQTRAAFLLWLQHYLTEQSVTTPLVWKALRKELWSYRHPKLHYLVTTIYNVKAILVSGIRRFFLRQGRSLARE